MSAENLFTTSRIENVNQIIAELYDCPSPTVLDLIPFKV